MSAMVSAIGGCSAGVNPGMALLSGSAHTADKRDEKDSCSFFKAGPASKDKVVCRVSKHKIIPNVGHVAARL